ncbi:uncharacterized protein [Eurosta solidaginis]|uniref:uncharacterized protein isoform X3 n=1 Tax=Eurosta solidaginis TaxID=178769 RepID=UPI003530B12E
MRKAIIGLQRENCEDQSNSSLGGDDVSSHISLQSAQKGSETSATTSCYETAHDTTGASAPSSIYLLDGKDGFALSPSVTVTRWPQRDSERLFNRSLVVMVTAEKPYCL